MSSIPSSRVLLAVATIVGGVVAYAPDPIEITEWTVPWANTRPRDPFVDRQGKVWFVGQAGHYVAYLEPKSGQFKRYELEPGTGPHNLIVDGDGTVWYAGNAASHIGRMDPRDGKVTKIAMPDSLARDPHTLVFDRAGDIWFTVQGGGYVGKLTKKTGAVQLVKVTTPRARPYGIVLDSKGRPWFNEFGTNKIGMIDPKTMALQEYALPAAGARGRRIAVTADDRVWYVDYARGFLGRMDPATGEVQEWAAPSGAQSRPYAMALDDRERIWFVESGVVPNKLVGFDTKTEQVVSITDVPSGGATQNTVRHMVFHRPTRELWFGTDAGTIARAVVPK
jgi:virginiamycin B lyase